jgi:hypothetical protein
VLDHPYCAKWLEVKVKQEQEELLDRIKAETEGACNMNNDQNTHIPLFKHSIETLLASGSASSSIRMTDVNTRETRDVGNEIPSTVTGIKFEHSNNEIRTPNGESLVNSNTPSTPITSSAATSRASSPTLPRRMSTRKKKETQAWATFKQGILIVLI